MIEVKIEQDKELINEALGISEERAKEIHDLVIRQIEDTATEDEATKLSMGNSAKCMKKIAENVDTIEEIIMGMYFLGCKIEELKQKTKRILEIAKFLEHIQGD